MLKSIFIEKITNCMHETNSKFINAAKQIEIFWIRYLETWETRKIIWDNQKKIWRAEFIN